MARASERLWKLEVEEHNVSAEMGACSGIANSPLWLDFKGMSPEDRVLMMSSIFTLYQKVERPKVG